MTIASLLYWLSAALSFVALVFLLMGLERTARLAAWAGRKPPAAADVPRLRLLRRSDWLCCAGTLAAALLAAGTAGFDTSPALSEPSGNAAGATLLVAIVVLTVVLLTLLVRQRLVSRALARLRCDRPPTSNERT